MKKVYLFLIQALMALSLVCATGCSKNDDSGGGGSTPGANKPPTCSITNPKANAQFNMDENIQVTVVAEDADGTIAEVQLYVDDIGYSLIAKFPYNFTINAGELNPGSHTLKAVAKDDQGAKGEATVTVTVNKPSTESPDFVSFSDGKIPGTWQTTAWVIDNTVGFDDIYSLKATESGVAVVTSKTFDVYSYVEFYTTGNNFYFYIDGTRVEPINSSNTGNWLQWIYAISPGTHVFKWESTSSNKLNLDAIKFTASCLPEVHTLDVTLPYDGFPVANVNYTLSSNGNNLITAHGVCWSTTPNPTASGNKTTNSGNTGSYMSTIENLVHNTTYYVRAYAVNGVGTTYGEELSFKTVKNFVGDNYQGGIVAYVSDETGEHGLITAPNDQSAGIQWYSDNWIATGTAIGTGQSNTTAIVQAQSSGNYAAKLCDDLVLNGYDDWFLPSKDELNLLYQNRNLIGGFSAEAYWSSSCILGNIVGYYAYFQSFYTGGQGTSGSKATTCRVRAVRAF